LFVVDDQQSRLVEKFVKGLQVLLQQALKAQWWEPLDMLEPNRNYARISYIWSVLLSLLTIHTRGRLLRVGIGVHFERGS
jgi:hypothetical protein